jgi:hypothetical protein
MIRRHMIQIRGIGNVAFPETIKVDPHRVMSLADIQGKVAAFKIPQGTRLTTAMFVPSARPTKSP